MTVTPGTSPSAANLYNENGTLTGNRSVALAGFTLDFDGPVSFDGEEVSTNPSSVVQIMSVADMPLTLAVDGVMRWHPALNTKYVMHGSLVIPRIWMPFTTILTSTQTFEIAPANQNDLLLFDGDDTPHIRGMNNNTLVIREAQLIDIGDTVLFDLSGSGFAALVLNHSLINGFKAFGDVVNMSIDFIDVPTLNLNRGLTIRNESGVRSSSFSLVRLLNPSSVVTTAPSICFIGNHSTISIGQGNIGIAASDSVICIDSAATGNFDIVGNSFDGVGNLFEQPISNSITAFSNDDIVITSFSDSAVNPGVDTSLNFAAATDLKPGQVILVADEAAYDGTQTIVRVANDLLSVDINVVFSTSGAGTLKRTNVNSVAHGFVRDQTNTIAGAPNHNGTTQILERVDDDNFIIPVTFVAVTGGGTVSSTSKNQDSANVVAALNGNAAQSTVTSEADLLTNALVTDIPAVDALVLMNATTWTGTEEVRMSVDTDGVTEYLGVFPSARIKTDGNITLQPANATKELSCRFVRQDAERRTVTFTNGTNVVDETGTLRVDGETFTFNDNAGTLPAELREDIVYFVVSQAANTFQLSYTSGGSVITFTDDGSGTNTYAVAETHGSSPSEPISSGASNSRTLVPQAISILDIGDKIFVAVSNNDDAVDLTVTKAYYRAFI